MSHHQKLNEVFFPPSQDEEFDGNWQTGSSGMMTTHEVPQIFDDPLNLWPSPPIMSFSSQDHHPHHHEISCADHYFNNTSILNNLSTTFDEAPPFQHMEFPVRIPCSENIISHGLDKGQSSGNKTQDKITHGDGAKEGCRQQKRKDSGEAYNRSNRLRRKIFNEKLKCLQELIPKCNKRKKESIIDDATKYIKNLQYQVQLQEQQIMGLTTTAGEGFPRMNNIMPQLSDGHQYLPTFTGMEYGMGMGFGMGIGMGMSYPMINESGLSNPGNNSLLSASSTSGLMHAPHGIPQSAHHLINTIPNNYPGNTVLEPYSGAL